MKLLSLLFVSIFSLQLAAQVAPAPQQSERKIQIAILFDTSGSMDGLIEQAKSVIWQIVNAASKLRINGQVPQLEIALYDYGNTDIHNALFVRKQVDLINDLDSISEKLFALYTNGGDEYCAGVIQTSMNELKWSSHPEDMRLIYIAGNEPFNQGPLDYKVILADAAKQNIIVNTIYCGNYEQGIKEFWYDGALISQGNYFNIDSNREAFYMETEYDKEINSYNDSLNGTYMSYGNGGKMRDEKQKMEDANAFSKGVGVASERAISKSNANYYNGSWDLIDLEGTDSMRVYQLKDEDLPEELKNKTPEEKAKIIEEKRAERMAYQQKINELAVKREAVINAEKQRRALESGQEDLGTSIIKSMNTSAEKKGYKTE